MLGAPTAFVLSQDQTLCFILLIQKFLPVLIKASFPAHYFSVQFTLLNRGSILFKLLCSSYLLHCLIFKIHYASPLLSGNSFILPHLVRFVKYFFQIPLSVLVRSLFVVPYYHITFASLCQVLFFAPCLSVLPRFDSFVILALPPPFRQPLSFLFYLLLIFFLSLLLFLSVSYRCV